MGIDLGQSASSASLGAAPYPPVHAELGVLVTVRNEAERLPAALAALAGALPGARVVVADDASTDATSAVARAAGADVVRARRRLGKGGAATLGARALLAGSPPPQLVLLCDGDLGASAAALAALPALVERGEADLVVAAFARREGGGGGVGIARGAARLAVARTTGLRTRAPLSGQRALRAAHLHALLPFARGFGMEVGMTIDAHRAGLRLAELELPLEHRRTGRSPTGFAHRGHQLLDVLGAACRPPRR
jgi:glycosyltransferase involved in cell wall biosynthesis